MVASSLQPSPAGDGSRLPRLLRRLLPVLLLLVSLPPPAAPLLSNGYYCKACVVLVEQAHAELFERIKRMPKQTAESKLELDVAATIRTTCAGPVLRAHTEPIREGCAQIAERNAGVFVAAFGNFNWRGRTPEPTQVFDVIQDACVAKMDLCAGSYCMVPPCADWRPANPCDDCKAVVQDVVDTLLRRRGGQGYLNAAHVWGVLESECSPGLLMRHPKAFAARLSETCDALMEEFDDDIAAVFLRGEPHPLRAICGPSMAAMCGGQGVAEEAKKEGAGGGADPLAAKKSVPQLNGDWDAWRGPWSHVSYVEAAEVLKEGMNRGGAAAGEEKKKNVVEKVKDSAPPAPPALPVTAEEKTAEKREATKTGKKRKEKRRRKEKTKKKTKKKKGVSPPPPPRRRRPHSEEL